jgi:hypothetical protein
MKCQLVALLVLTALPAYAQNPPADSCGPGDSLGGSDMFPFSGSANPATNTFAMTGTQCSEVGKDAVVCFRPTSSCDVNIRCAFVNTTVAANLFLGPCESSPAACVQSATAQHFASIDASLSGGQEYCVVCETSDTTFTFSAQVDIMTTAGNCGPLPVELESFIVE